MYNFPDYFCLHYTLYLKYLFVFELDDACMIAVQLHCKHAVDYRWFSAG